MMPRSANAATKSPSPLSEKFAPNFRDAEIPVLEPTFDVMPLSSSAAGTLFLRHKVLSAAITVLALTIGAGTMFGPISYLSRSHRVLICVSS